MRTSIGISQAPVWEKLGKLYQNKSVNNNLIHYYLRSLNVMTIQGEINGEVKETIDLAITQVKNHLNDPGKSSLSIYLNFSPFNTKASVHLLRMMNILNKYHNQGKEIDVFWSLGTEEHQIDLGLDLIEFCDFNFEIVNV